MISGRSRAMWATYLASTMLAMVSIVAPVAAALPTAAPPSADDIAPAAAPAIAIEEQLFSEREVQEGATFKVAGTGWPADTLIQLEVCGAEARSGTSDCASDAAQVVASNVRGTFEGRLALVVPPSPCPCVVRALSQTTTDTALTPIEIPGAPTSHAGDGDITAPALRRLEASNVELSGSDNLRTWMGASPQRVFMFELKNTGSVAVNNATVTMTAGPSDNPTGFVKPVKIERMEVGQTRKISVPIEFPNLSYGEQSVRATLNGTSMPTTFAATTTTHPWLVIIIPIVVVLQLLLLLIRNALRRRLNEADVVPAEVDPSIPADDSLICVVEFTEADPNATPNVQHRTQVVRSINEVRQMVLDALKVDEQGQPVAVAGPERVINTITVLADADARVGASHHACDVLCTWIESTYTNSSHPSARSLTLRRHNSGTSTNVSAASGLGMVPLSVLVRAPHIRAAA